MCSRRASSSTRRRTLPGWFRPSRTLSSRRGECPNTASGLCGHAKSLEPQVPKFLSFCIGAGLSRRSESTSRDLLARHFASYRSVRSLPAGTAEGPISAPIRATAVIHARKLWLSTPGSCNRSGMWCPVAVCKADRPERPGYWSLAEANHAVSAACTVVSRPPS